jgi:acyl-CoA reductase-like NAD-dependent aldehyde dehydrogenase/nicotinamidase-related amidase
MKPLLLLIDLQHDFLQNPGVEPAAGAVVERAARLLENCRSLSIPVVHVWTTSGTDGPSPPELLRPAAGEDVVHRTFLSAFSTGDLDRLLGVHHADTLLIAGLSLHEGIRQTALDACERRLDLWLADDAVASDDPLHAAVTRRYLQDRGIPFAPVDQLVRRLRPHEEQGTPERLHTPALAAARINGKLVRAPQLPTIPHQSPRRPELSLWTIPVCDPEQVAEAAAAARRAWPDWSQTEPSVRASLLERLAERLQRESSSLAHQMAEAIGKPLVYAKGEALRTADLLRAVARRVGAQQPYDPGSRAAARHRAVGVMALVTPWNNPLYIPVGKIAPALLYGNTVVWKPAPTGSSLALRVMEYLAAAGCPPGVVNCVCGNLATAQRLMAAPEVDAVALTGSSLAGYAAQEICGRRRIPLQAELGGNNAALVWSDADLPDAAQQVAAGAFDMAGQRCTANRRVVVDERCYDAFLQLLEQATAALPWGDPLETSTRVGPLISIEQRDRVAGVVERALPAASQVLVPHAANPACRELARVRTFYPPTIICCDDPRHEIVQEETFGPVLVVQRASDWDQALALGNGVRQGLALALFSSSKTRQASFLAQAQAGILKLNRSTADAELDIPFGGWKSSGLGPPEHGDSDREFYTRTQAIYQ